MTTARPFLLRTASTSYVVSLLPDGSGLVLDQWGPATDLPEPSVTVTEHPQLELAADVTPLEYASNGTRYSHQVELIAHYPGGVAGSRWQVDEAAIAYVCGPQGDALDVPLDDESGTLRLVLHTRTDRRHDVVRRWATISRAGGGDGETTDQDVVTLRRCFSAGWPLPLDGPVRIDYLAGEWSREFGPEHLILPVGTFSIGSRRGHTGHEFAPVVTLTEAQPADPEGPRRAYGIALAFSGSWRIAAESAVKSGGAGRRVRLSAGVDDQDTVIRLAPGDSFVTPECHGVFSADGSAGVTQAWHRFQRQVLARDLSPATRPVVYNSWYATEFDIRTDQQIVLADRAAALGVEVFVVDDGWMPGRTTDTAGLGDWWADPVRFPEGLHPIADAVLERGMRFGLWVEPEMVNPDSELYRAHPDWIYRAGARPPVYVRNQLVLDFGRAEVVEWASDQLRRLLRTYPISYLKWDFNRPISDGGRPGDLYGDAWAVQHAEGYHQVMRMLRHEFPAVTVEACAGGGGRIDHCVLAVSDVVWPSDETGPRDRLAIQHGFLSVYAPHVMSSWVTDLPGTDDRSSVSEEFRFLVAMAGVLGVGSDISRWDERRVERARTLINLYKEIRPIVHTGTVRVHGRPGRPGYALEYAGAAERPGQVVLLVYDADRDRRDREVRIRPYGLQAGGRYRIRGDDRVFSGAGVQAAGLVVPFRLAVDCDVLIIDPADPAELTAQNPF